MLGQSFYLKICISDKLHPNFSTVSNGRIEGFQMTTGTCLFQYAETNPEFWKTIMNWGLMVAILRQSHLCGSLCHQDHRRFTKFGTSTAYGYFSKKECVVHHKGQNITKKYYLEVLQCCVALHQQWSDVWFTIQWYIYYCKWTHIFYLQYQFVQG